MDGPGGDAGGRRFGRGLRDGLFRRGLLHRFLGRLRGGLFGGRLFRDGLFGGFLRGLFGGFQGLSSFCN
jgi:hypothetical protein